ncbi:substrate-binding domain-containing protein [Streptomyces sp. ISL-94]|uniref:substrate-binding domain-containing protein n=1 Tax=Streptomyces sp. ISL-94 TaxID=2819190 RepID=UPI001BEBB5FA|nr:substrate-binding domain-containing protein [Streptomyces sp. ISL-94]MBT2477569.1 DeoR/GlpR family transcriptional regulator [Streptomyces sp. ISL-94]
MRPHVNQRQAHVLALVRERGSVRVAELAQELGISPVTLRRDIEAMAARGEIQRMHGVISRVQAGSASLLATRAGAAGGAATTAPGGSAGSGAGQGLVIGMVVPTTEYYYAEVVQGARAVVEARGARLTVGLTRYLPGEDRTQADRLLSTGAHGLLLTPNWEAGAPGPGEGAWTAELPVPTVLVERWAPPGHPAAALDRVASDHAHGAARAVQHLAGLGHQRIALASRSTPTSTRLRSGYEAAVAALGLEPAPPWPPYGPGPVSDADLFSRMLEYLCDAVTTGGVTAALIHSDTDAIMLIPRLQARGVRVPEDLAVITYDDEVAGMADVPLSAVAPAKREVGARAAGLLLDRLSGLDPEENPRQHLELLPRLTIRS